MPTTNPPVTQPHALGMVDVLFVLFRDKWMILIFGLLGIIAAVVLHVSRVPKYSSYAKLLVRYVVDRSAVDSIDNNAAKTNDSVFNAEVEILRSWDLAVQVAETIGVDRLKVEAQQGDPKTVAAGRITSGLTVSRIGNVLFVVYSDTDAELARQVLEELVTQYFTKHLEVHRSIGAFEFVARQMDQVRGRLNDAEQQLKKLKADAQVTSLPGNTASVNAAIEKIQGEILATKAQRAEQLARVKELEGTISRSEDSVQPQISSSGNPPGAAEIGRYKEMTARLAQLRRDEAAMILKYTPENRDMQVYRTQIAETEREVRKMEKAFPGILAAAPATSSMSEEKPPDLPAERAKLTAIEAKAEALQSQLAELTQRAKQLAELTPQIEELERKKELEDANYKYFGASLEKARVDEALDPSKIPNISIVQKPSPPSQDRSSDRKVLLGLAGGGFGIGIAISVVLGLVFDDSIKRALEIEDRLRIPLLLSIPFLGDCGRKSLLGRRRAHRVIAGSGKEIARSESAPWEVGHFIRPFTEAIRDRLGFFFDLSGLTHKPKLLGVAAFRTGAGTSTLAAGVAAALSETGGGKVLLVALNVGRAEVQPFLQGRPSGPENASMQNEGPSLVTNDNLYVATVGTQETRRSDSVLNKLHGLLAGLQTSEFDYIVFDMPPLGTTSPTGTLLPLMDKALLVVEAERDSSELVKRGYAELVARGAKVACVFNKSHSYLPKAFAAS